jgi:hypothetical protein
MLTGDLQMYEVVDGLGQVKRHLIIWKIKLHLNCLAIVLIWNIIWFIPLDFIKFALQAAFDRSVRTVRPFEHIHRRLIALKQAKTSVQPSNVVDQIIDDRREHSGRLSKQ